TGYVNHGGQVGAGDPTSIDMREDRDLPFAGMHRRWVIEDVETQNERKREPLSAVSTAALPPGTTQRTLAIIMGGGAGTRLFPLTKDRAKPAVPLGGKYRIVDISISNCLNSGLRSIYVLTQFNSMSLHRHIQASYKFDNFSRSFIDILAAQQTPQGSQ